MAKQRQASRALQAALDSWNWRPPPNPRIQLPTVESPTSRGVRTESSVTVFSGDLEEWVDYLRWPVSERVESGISVRAYARPEGGVVAFDGENDDSQWLAGLLSRSFAHLRGQLAYRPHVHAVLDSLVFESSNARVPITIQLSPDVPSDGARETDREEPISDVRIVLHSRMARYVHDAVNANVQWSAEEQLGYCWPLASRVIFGLGYPAAPRDRYAAKVEVAAKIAYIAVHLLFEGHRSGQLVASATGQRFAAMVSQTSGIPTSQLAEHHPYWRMLGRLLFALRGTSYASYADDIRTAVREYLDTVYLRLSLASAMPGVAAPMQPMPIEYKGDKIRTPKPKVGLFGILDDHDLDAWRVVEKPFKEIGYSLVRQVGMGEFGRVYEALNENNRQYPERVALKVDRIVGKKKHAILEAEAAMQVGRALAHSSHLIRLYDTGKLRGERYTYHVLQLIDGDTLDNLVRVTGKEHASVSRPPAARATNVEGQREYERAVDSGQDQSWRRARMNQPFEHMLSTAMVLDLLTSVLLWLEDVHRIGYAINDLKNGNLMMSRRGQLKGIDLDSYAPVHSPRDKVPDFMFLAVSLILLLFSVPVTNRGRHPPWQKLIESEAQLRSGLVAAWPFGDVKAYSAGRVTNDELTQVLVDLVQRSRQLIYTKNPDLFSSDIGRLILLKRRLLFEEMVID
jgi:hypothetical protein